jgi:hypothetical protein
MEIDLELSREQQLQKAEDDTRQKKANIEKE